MSIFGNRRCRFLTFMQAQLFLRRCHPMWVPQGMSGRMHGQRQVAKLTIISCSCYKTTARGVYRSRVLEAVGLKRCQLAHGPPHCVILICQGDQRCRIR